MTEKRTILLVDDDSAIRKGASLRLRASGYDTLDASDGGQGVATAIKSKPDAIVMDVRMPRMDGLAALSALQENEATKDIPVVMLSASLMDQQLFCLSWTLSGIDELEYSSPPGVHDVPTQAIFP